jgi:hypothetical protein
MAEDRQSLRDEELLERLGAAYRDLPGTSGEVLNLLWDEILELHDELKSRYPPITEPLRPHPPSETT